jgi:4-hydroxythreonine-4-phosphate dehydrogenase
VRLANASTSSTEFNYLPPLALTIGEPAGIGPEIALLAWKLAPANKLKPFVLVGDHKTMVKTGARLDIPVTKVNSSEAACAQFASALPVLDVPMPGSVQLGNPSPETAQGVIAAIDTAVGITLRGEARAVVTNPIQKSVLTAAGFNYPGHTEYLAHLAEKAGHRATPVMMLANEKLKAIPVTVHIALADVTKYLTTELIVSTARIAHRDLVDKFGIARPRLAISGLNPHAGEAGTMGAEDITIIAPAIAQLLDEGIIATGPLPADTMFHDEARAEYDAAICMYHDQALIPVKTLGFHDGVNVTLGLPFVRTSPDHGTALALAGTGNARPDSLIAALRLADQLTRKHS